MPRRRRRSPAPTPEEIWRILRGTAREARIARRARRRHAEESRRLDFRLRQEAAAHTRKLEQEAAERRAALEASEAAWREEFERERREREQADAERDRSFEKEIYRILGDGDNRWGTLIEGLVEGNVKKLFRDIGMDVEYYLARRRSYFHDIWREYDLVGVGKSDAVVVEVKTKLRPADVSKFTSRMGDFREWRPDDARPRVFGALAYLTAIKDATEQAEETGFYLVEAVSGTARIVNSPDFTPRLF